MADSQHLTDEFGQDQLAEDNGETFYKQGRGAPKDMTEENVKKINEGYDPYMWAVHRPDGSWIRSAYGKNPSYSFRTSHGYHKWIVGNGNTFEYHPSSHHTVGKGDHSETFNGSKDQLVHNVGRNNRGTEKGGGYYSDAGKGGHASGAGTGGFASYSDGDRNVATAGHMKHTAAKTFTWGRGTNSGEMRQFVHMDESGNMTIACKGDGGDISIQCKNGNIKIAGAKGLSFEASQGDMTFSAKGGSISLSAGKTINLGAGSDILASHPLPGPTSIKTNFAKERNGVHSPQYASKTGTAKNSEIS